MLLIFIYIIILALGDGALHNLDKRSESKVSKESKREQSKESKESKESRVERKSKEIIESKNKESKGEKPGKTTPPHILFIFVDDLGFDDISWNQAQSSFGEQYSTPYIDELAQSGVTLGRYYTQPLCSPSRVALMTGKYPSKLGQAAGVIYNGIPMALDLDEKILPQFLAEAGYESHIFGKWDLGMTKWEHTPTFRGFDSFLGFYNAAESYSSHLSDNEGVSCDYQDFNNDSVVCGFDFRYNTEPATTDIGVYSPFLLTQAVLDTVEERIVQGESKPQFLYLAHQLVHHPNEVPDWYLQDCPNPNPNPQSDNTNYMDQRRLHCGMTRVLDESVGNLTTYLKEQQLLDQFLIILSSDNGGDILHGASNYPLRGNKFTVFEGGVRGIGIVSGWGIPASVHGTVRNGLMHLVDWLPTLLTASGMIVGKKEKDSSFIFDGVDQWLMITGKKLSLREQLLIQMNPAYTNISAGINFPGQAALIQGKYKIIVGAPQGDMRPNGWGNLWQLPNGTIVTPADANKQVGVWLFNLAADPTETMDLSNDTDIVAQLLHALHMHEESAMIPQLFWTQSGYEPESNPHNFDGFWTPWMR
eukprot:gb/GEZN01005313.1/.p1 GENE.gb/GEZN01005313.1/~~gb/GEZN01005313.1/.p1  ORF type:complete len:588 (-),score=79.68 gb/GEZN01005313.1/:35-1798(-)